MAVAHLTVLGTLLLALVGCGQHGFGCYTDGRSTKCESMPLRRASSETVRVYMQNDGACTVNARITPCSAVGKIIRAAHPGDDPTVSFCAGNEVQYTQAGLVIASINSEFLPFRFDCQSHAASGTVAQLRH